MRYFYTIPLLLICLNSCITKQYMGSLETSQSKVENITNYGFHGENLVVNLEGGIKNRKVKDFHITIPLSDYISEFNATEESFVTIKNNKHLRKMYLLDHDNLELTKPILVMELNRSAFKKGIFESAEFKVNDNVKVHDYTFQNQYVFNLEDYPNADPIILVGEFALEKFQNYDFDKIAFVIESKLFPKQFPYFLPVTMLADGIIILPAIALCELIGGDCSIDDFIPEDEFEEE